MTEQVTGIIPNVVPKFGSGSGVLMTGMTYFDLIITDRRIIGAKSGSRLLTIAVGGELGDLVVQRRAGSKFEGLDLEQVLHSDEKNFCWNLDGIIGIEVKKGVYGVTTDRIVFHLASGKQEFIFRSRSKFNEAQALLSEILRDKIQAESELATKPQPPLISQPPSQPAISTRICPNCGASLADGVKFCGKCGAKVEERVARKFCPSCGAQITPEMMFCGGCGGKV